MPYLGWGVVALLGLGAMTWIGSVSRFAGIALVHDMLPVLLCLAWLVLPYGLVTQQWLLAAMAALLVGFHLKLVLPRVFADPAPAWVPSAAQLTVAVANVYVGNKTPDAFAALLVGAGSDLLVVTERNDEFMLGFGRAGGGVAYPHSVDEPSGRPDYEIAIASRLELLPGSRVLRAGTLRIVRAVVPCGGSELSIVGVHLCAVTEPRGFREWRHEVAALTNYVADLPAPFVVVGDFNSTGFRPAFADPLRAAGLIEAHRAAGKGLSRSLKFAARGVLSAFPAMARVDHALLSPGVHALELVNLPTAGSDHHPFVVTLAVRQPPE